MATLLWHFSEKNSIIARNYSFAIVNRIVFKIFWCRVFSDFLPQKKKLKRFYTRKEKEKSTYFPCFCMKKTKLVPGKKKHWNSPTELMIWPTHQQQPTTCTRELLARELAQCSQCWLIWDENMHVGMELVEHKCELIHKLCPYFLWGTHGTGCPGKNPRESRKSKRISFSGGELPLRDRWLGICVQWT
jgi:hypothetical protein